MWGHTEPFHSLALPVLLPSWSPVTCRVHSLDGDADHVPNHLTEDHQELGAFRQVPPKGWCIRKDGLGSRRVIQTWAMCRASLLDVGAVGEQSPLPVRVSWERAGQKGASWAHVPRGRAWQE